MSNTMLYRPGKALRVWNQYWVDTLIVPQDEVEQRLAEGWHLRPGDWEQNGEQKAADQKTGAPKGKRGRGAAAIAPEGGAGSGADAADGEQKAAD